MRIENGNGAISPMCSTLLKSPLYLLMIPEMNNSSRILGTVKEYFYVFKYASLISSSAEMTLYTFLPYIITNYHKFVICLFEFLIPIGCYTSLKNIVNYWTTLYEITVKKRKKAKKKIEKIFMQSSVSGRSIRHYILSSTM